jgi:transposase
MIKGAQVPRPHSTMRQIREILRLRFSENLSLRDVASSLDMPFTSVGNHVRRAQRAGVSWPLGDDLDDDALERLLFGDATPSSTKPEPDFVMVDREVRKKGVTLMLLWLEYLEVHPGGYQYTQFCVRYRTWKSHVDAVMRQNYAPGEKLFIDYPGLTIPLYDPETLREVSRCELFVTVLGAGSLLYCEATPSQELEHWVMAHTRALSYYGGAPKIFVPDNLRSGISSAHRYEALVNPTYLEMARHYGCVVIPARPYKPRDKAKVESGVQVAERWIIARLRHERFTNLASLNAAIAPLVEIINDRPFKKIEGSRRSLFEELDRSALGSLPLDPYEFATWKQVRVARDYHVEVKGHYYSVPYALVGKVVDVRVSEKVVEVFFKNRRVASHAKAFVRNESRTDLAHMPASHRRHAEWTPARILDNATRIGPETQAFIHSLLEDRPHPEQGFRSALGVIRLESKYGQIRLEAACARALAAQTHSMRSVESILQHGLERAPLVTEPTRAHPDHDNIRGPDYYH